MALIDKLTALGDAIREQTGGTEPLTLDAMVVTIKNLDFSKTTPINVVPSTASTFTYDGTEKTPVWQNFDTEQLTIGGTTSATNAGTYTVYFTPKAGYTWADESVESKTVTWSIAKATGTLSLSATSGSILDQKGTTTTFNVNYNGDAAISVVSSNTGVATVSISGNTVTVTSVANGSATITVSVADSVNYSTPTSVTYAVQVEIRLYLYRLGDKCTSNGTGSWTAVGKSHSWDYNNGWPNFNAVAPTISWNSNNVTLKEAASYKAAIFYKNTKINLTDYSKIVFDGYATGSGDFKIYVWSAIDTYYSVNVAASANISKTSRGLTELSISSLNNTYYVGLNIAASDAAKTGTMYQMYLC